MKIYDVRSIWEGQNPENGRLVESFTNETAAQVIALALNGYHHHLAFSKGRTYVVVPRSHK